MAWVTQDIERRFNRELFRVLGPDRYALWVRHALPALLDEDQFTFHFPSTHAKDKVESLLREPVVAAAQRVANRNVRVSFAVESGSFVLPPGDPEPPRRDASFTGFVVGSGNRLAHAAAKAFVRGGPAGPRLLLLHAASGLGRSHLLRAIHAELVRRPDAGVLLFDGEQFRRQSREAQLRDRRDAFVKKCRSASVFLLDDLHLLCGRDDAQAALAEILEGLAERSARAALTSECHPRTLDRLSRRLQARLRADLEASIERPDRDCARQILRAAAPASVPAAALDYIVTHVTSSPSDQLACLARLLEQPPFTLPSARSAVAEFLNHWTQGLSFEDIVRAAAEDFDVSVGEIYSLGRSREAAEARQACFYLARKLLGSPFAQIGDHFAGRDHSTVHEACRKLEKWRGAAREKLRRLEEKLSPQAK